MRSLKAFLAILILGAVLPGLLFGVGTSWWLAREMRLGAEQEAKVIAQKAASDVAEHVRLVSAAMKVLARSPALARDDLAEAYQFASSLAADLNQHIGLATAEGEQFFNTRRPLGTPLPRRADATSYSRALQTGQPSVSNIIIGALAQKPLITIDVAAMTPAGPRVLGTSTDLDTIGAILARTPLKPGWKAAVVDGEGRFIARSLDPENYLGKPAVPEVVAVAKSDRPDGSFRNRSHEGAELLSFFSKVPGTSWTVVIGTPEPNFLAPLRGSVAVLAVSGAVAVALTLLVAVMLGRRLNSAARRLTRAAHAMGRGHELPPLRQSIAEFEQVEAAFHEAARASRERQAELAFAREAAEQSVAVKNRFIAAASHDLRQPLHASGLCIQLLAAQTATEKQVRYLNGLSQAHASMSTLIDTLFDIAKMDAEGLSPTFTTVSVSDFVGRVALECHPPAQEKGLELRVRSAPGLGVLSDEQMLARVLRNLVHNAIRYTDAGGILIACRRRPGAVWIEVWDTGIGIPADQVPLIWEEFYQVGARREGKGSGLGLAIVWRLLKALGGGVEVRSRPGRGSLFRLVVPSAPLAPPARPKDPDADDTAMEGLVPVARPEPAPS